jgi:hypothetical protein
MNVWALLADCTSGIRGIKDFTTVKIYETVRNTTTGWPVKCLILKWNVYYESIKRELKIRPIYECRCDESLKTKVKEFTRLGAPSKLSVIRRTAGLVRMFPTRDLIIEEKAAWQ